MVGVRRLGPRKPINLPGAIYLVQGYCGIAVVRFIVGTFQTLGRRQVPRPKTKQKCTWYYIPGTRYVGVVVVVHFILGTFQTHGRRQVPRPKNKLKRTSYYIPGSSYVHFQLVVGVRRHGPQKSQKYTWYYIPGTKCVHFKLVVGVRGHGPRKPQNKLGTIYLVAGIWCISSSTFHRGYISNSWSASGATAPQRTKMYPVLYPWYQVFWYGSICTFHRRYISNSWLASGATAPKKSIMCPVMYTWFFV